MQTSRITIVNRLGLHARASAKLTKLAGAHRCQVHLSRNGRRVNAKSIMGVLMLAAGVGSEIEIETDGDDEGAAMRAIRSLVEDRFGEGE
jgi:phosphocarrier protein HPr